jgi:DNA-directed RNA polymerase sigma subunit (sigma70/sigma32)
VLAKRIEEGDQSASEAMVAANLRLVVSIAKRYRNQLLLFTALIQETEQRLRASLDDSRPAPRLHPTRSSPA